MDKVNVLVIGSGGREHTMVWKLLQSPKLGKIYIAPGNAGTNQLGINVPLAITDFEGIKNLIIAEKIHLVIVGPEEPLVKGIREYLFAESKLSKLLFIGPDSIGAALEGSKNFAKQFMKRHNIPTASYETFDASNIEKGYAFLKTLKPPYVLKADGLAAGKGVIICNKLEDAVTELNSMLLDRKFGTASENVVIEEFLDGIELSAFAITDGNHYLLLPEAKDYKRIGEKDTGPNTGGMGSVSPVPFADKTFMKKVEDRVIRPTVEGLKAEGISYCGFIFAGLMNVNGNPYVIEYNVRMGDPETEVILPRIQSDLLDVFIATTKRKLNAINLEIDKRAAACIMLVASGYPGKYLTGHPVLIKPLDKNVMAFHCGTVTENIQGKVLSNGGRVIAVVSYGDHLKEAIDNSYQSISSVYFKDMNFRRDIGLDVISLPPKHN